MATASNTIAQSAAETDTAKRPDGVPRVILGISCDFHDAAAAVIVDGEVVAAAEEERFTRVKHDNSLPENAVASILETAGLAATDIEAVIFHEKPMVVMSRVLAARQRRGLMSLGKFVNEVPVMLRRNLMVAYRIERMLARMGAKRSPRLLFSEHHISHASAAFYPSPFATAAILTVDGIGEWSTATIGHGIHHRLEMLEEQRFPNSFGLLYSLVTDWCGFEPNDGEYKLMGLAPFGQPRFREAIDAIAKLSDDGALEIDGRAVKWWGARTTSLKKLTSLFEGPPSERGAQPGQREADLARSVQQFTEDALLKMAAHAQALTGESALVMAGGVALNCVANGRLLREGPFDEIWVQPAAGDAGSAIGAALWLWHSEHSRPRKPTDRRFSCALGPEFDAAQATDALTKAGIAFETVDDDEVVARTAASLADGDVVAWFQGRMEFGPRALGNRSFLADARSESMQHRLNMATKGREGFRPFAPAVLADRASEWFEIEADSPYMLLTHQVAANRLLEPVDAASTFVEQVAQVRSDIPACTHVDNSARVQTVSETDNARFFALLTEFDRLTGCPVLLNTSFNRAGEPIVCTPAEACATALAAKADLLVIGNLIASLRHRHSAGGDSTNLEGEETFAPTPQP